MASKPFNVGSDWKVNPTDASVHHRCSAKSDFQPTKHSQIGADTVPVCIKCDTKATSAVTMVLKSVQKALNNIAGAPQHNERNVQMEDRNEDTINEETNEDLDTAEEFAREIGLDPEDTDDEYPEDEEDLDTTYEEEKTEEIAAAATTGRAKVLGNLNEALHTDISPPAPSAKPNDEVATLVSQLMANPEAVKQLQTLLSSAKTETNRKADPGSDDVTFEVLESHKEGYCQLQFSDKPSQTIRTEMRDALYRYNPKTKLWYGKLDLLLQNPRFSAKLQEFASRNS